jgi:hypothetical protein
MAAGQGFKNFVTGEVLTAGDVNGYLMQGINVFASTAARDAAITAPAEGQFAFTKDTNGLWYYDGAAWVASGATGDIEGVTAGVGISGGGTSGTVTVTNSMATAIDAKGDLVPGTGADTFSRLAVGANNTVLTADSAEATGLKWATVAAGGMTLLSTTSLTGATTTISSINQTYNTLMIVVYGVTNATSNGIFRIAPNNNTGITTQFGTNTSSSTNLQPSQYIRLTNGDGVMTRTNANNSYCVQINNYANATNYKSINTYGTFQEEYSGQRFGLIYGGGIETNSAITSLVFSNSGGDLSTGTVLLYGVK